MATLSLPSVQSLLIEMFFGGQSLSTGTGFVCGSAKGPVLITNWHNVAGRNPQTGQPLSPTAAIPDRIKIVHNKKDSLGSWVLREEPLYVAVQPRWIEHPTLGSRADFVALPLTDLNDVHLYPYDVLAGPAIAVSAADSISVVGFPFGLQAGGSLAVWATGFIASEPQVDFNGLPIFLIDCRTRPGQSGSAVIIHRNSATMAMQDGSTAVFTGQMTKFQGIYSGRINEQSDLGIVWKADAINQLLISI